MVNNSEPASADLTSLSPTELIARINDLESRLRSTTAQLAELTGTPTIGSSETKSKKVPKPFDFSRYSTRHIALKFAYLGHRYNGLEHTNGGIVPLRPTVEEALWKALRKARLIPTDVPEGCDGSYEVVFGEQERKRMYGKYGLKLEIDWTGLGYSKCGRTDKGVSAFEQVVGLRVRSNRPKRVQKDAEGEGVGEESTATEDRVEEKESEFDDVRDEISYISALNGLLPSDIRITAWCPNAGTDFDARFGCRERRYKYFFTNPAFCPTPGPHGLKHADGTHAPVREGWLDIDAMRKAAKKLEGLHDFRNFCKIDASKQMSSCERRITFANIEEMPAGIDLERIVTDENLAQYDAAAAMVDGEMFSYPMPHGPETFVSGPRVFAFAVHGTAFLWHQVRCMVAVLFLIGQGLERPELVDELLDISKNPARPHYEMADDAPLVLWNCVFPGDTPGDEGGLRWLYAGDEAGMSPVVKKGEAPYDGKFGVGGLVNEMWNQWREAKMKETLTAGLLSVALDHGDGTSLQRGGFRAGANPRSRSQRVFDGNDYGRTVGDYTPVMQKPRMATLEAQNAKFLEGKQARRDLKKSQTTNNE